MADYLAFDFGIVSFALDPGFDNPDAHTLVDKVNLLQIPGEHPHIELLVMPSSIKENIKNIADRIHKGGYGVSVTAFRPNSDDSHKRGAPDMMAQCIAEVDLAVMGTIHIMECAVEAGATRIGGPWYRNHPNRTVRDQEQPKLGQYFIGALERIARKAEQLGVYMCMEMLNAWEMSGCNTVATTLPYVKEVNSPNLLIHLDPAHSSREEQNYIRAAETAYDAGRLGHVHISENGRGPIEEGPVSDHLVDFFYTLAKRGYGNNGELAVVEVFHPSMWGAIMRADNIGMLQKPMQEQDSFALQQAVSSFETINIAYKAAQKRLAVRQ